MRHSTFARWSTQESRVHTLDPRVKLGLLLAFVISLALVRSPSPLQLAICLASLLLACMLAGLPVWRVLRLSFLLIPFVGVFSLIVYLTGDGGRAWSILAKSYLSMFSVLVCISSTTLPQLLAAGRFFRIPPFLLEVTQLSYRYLFLITGQARAMQTAFRSRGGKNGLRALQASSGMVAVLFTRSYEKADRVHTSMLARGFSGTLTHCEFSNMRAADLTLLALGIAALIGLHFI